MLSFRPQTCQDCGVNMGMKPDLHSCNQEQYLVHQQQKWAAEIRNKLEPDLQAFLSSPQGRFCTWLIEKGRL